ncbi:amino acid ABC transporter substrate-binding protein [Plastoroseomonas arctica]|uniref:Amino acid ABC transporter substrate-binding protein n=1 Tax=Plastoroseomonas arctica TaxID=1509237 RepID=A0AAF1KHL6_9PROT|nr:amino acid ABC transporter substrate-binding protein [Plastoroseomonas arctica]MBR0654074.1 amino acid ABC transporter substrate-binding protein [Plastoroseomonas arctica]
MKRLLTAFALLAGGMGAALAQPASSSATFDAVRARGHVVCGTAPNLAGFAAVDSRGEWRGLYVDGCRAVAAAMFGDATRVRFVATTLQNRLPMLQAGEIDILVSNTTWTLTREASLGLQFTGVTFYDGQGFLVRRSLGVTSARQLDGATICVQPGTTTELNLADYFRRRGMRLNPLVIDNVEELRGAITSGRCDAYTIGTAALTAFRAGLGAQGEDFMLLPELISKEPLGPVIRKGDQRWFDLVRWAGFVPLLAEEFGITSENVAARLNDPDPEVQRFLGRTGGFGTMLGVQDDWAFQIIRQVGNYQESWDRNVAPLGLARGINRLWSEGGIHYPPPAR